MKTVIFFILFQLGYFLALYSAINNWAYFTIIYALLFVALHFNLLEKNQRKAEMIFLISAGLIGICSDLAFDQLHVYRFTTAKNILSITPEWLVGLWLIFPTLFVDTLKWMQGRWMIAFIFGFIFSPLSYRYGASLGVVEIKSFSSYIIIGVLWGILMPVFVYYRRYLNRNFT